MSPLAQLLQIKPAELKREENRSTLGKAWAWFVGILRSAKVQRRVRRIEIVERIALGNKQSVVLLRLDQREFMVGCCGDSVVLLAPPATPDTVEKSILAKSAAAKQVKAPTKRKLQTKTVRSKSGAKPKLTAKESVRPAATVISSAAQANLQETGKQTTASDSELPLERRVPTKARLVRAFGGRG